MTAETQPDNTPAPLVVSVPRSDPDMERAYQEARQSISQFLERLHQPTPTQEYAAVKVRIGGEDRDHYIWVSEVTWDGIRFAGFVYGVDVPSPFESGDEYEARPDDIYDWMIIDGGRLMGGYTIRVARSEMTIENRERYDASLWFTVE
jgi:uncharacterized protein YegJ (DUF2314 family)